MSARFERRPTPSPSFNRGWRLGVAFGAAIVLLATLTATGALLVRVIGVWVD